MVSLITLMLRCLAPKDDDGCPAASSGQVLSSYRISWSPVLIIYEREPCKPSYRAVCS